MNGMRVFLMLAFCIFSGFRKGVLQHVSVFGCPKKIRYMQRVVS